MREYYFWYFKGTSRPEGHIRAKTDEEFYAKLGPWLKERGGAIDTSTKITWQESGFIPAVPPETVSHEPHWSVLQTEDGHEYLSKAQPSLGYGCGFRL